MSPDPSFHDLIRRVRAGDDVAAAELVRRYEPTLRVVVRVRLNDPRLRRLLDSVDICQSVLGNFFARAALGQFELDTPEHLLKLLSTMARNKLLNLAAQQRAARRDHRRVQPGTLEDHELADPGPSPSQLVAHRELLQEFRSRLTEEERWLADQQAAGRPWAEIAAEVGGSPDALRMRLNRAIDRVARELRLG
jgi:RNA polymerase sigma-70 factor (ECF subfamily)